MSNNNKEGKFPVSQLIIVIVGGIMTLLTASDAPWWWFRDNKDRDPVPGPERELELDQNVFKEIIFFEKNGIKEVCINLPRMTSDIQFHAWRSDGSAIDLPMNTKSESSCMYWINLPAGTEGGTLKIDGEWAVVGDFLVRAKDGCSEVITINEGIIKASTSPNSSLLGAKDSINGNSGKWGWACK